MMFFYFGKSFNATQTAGYMVGVNCDNCGCEYYYEFTRTGKGGGEAPYGIGKKSAARSAQESAERDLSERLTSEAELVPCPKCGWINEELIQGYRRGQYRGCGVLAAFAAVAGTMLALFTAWIISRSPSADRRLVLYFLYGGPAFFVCLAAGTMLLRRWLRSRIQPNRRFPSPPAVPPGSPRALFKNASGQFEPANPFDVDDGVDFTMGIHQPPQRCCDCLQSAAPGSAYRLSLGENNHFEIPRCASCARLSRSRFFRLFIMATGFGLLVGIGGPYYLGLASFSLWIMVGLGLLIYLAVAFSVIEAATATAKVVAGERPPNVVRLRFRNAEYARVCAAQFNGVGTEFPKP